MSLASGILPPLVKLLPSPVAYSDPILGSTFSEAESETKRENGMSQTHRPKKDAISVKDGELLYELSYAEMRR